MEEIISEEPEPDSIWSFIVKDEIGYADSSLAYVVYAEIEESEPEPYIIIPLGDYYDMYMSDSSYGNLDAEDGRYHAPGIEYVMEDVFQPEEQILSDICEELWDEILEQRIAAMDEHNRRYSADMQES